MYQCTQEALLQVLLGTRTSAVLVHTPPVTSGPTAATAGPQPQRITFKLDLKRPNIGFSFTSSFFFGAMVDLLLCGC